MDIRVKKDGTAVAIKRDLPEDSPMLWGVMTIDNGGHYGPASEVADDEIWEDPRGNVTPE